MKAGILKRAIQEAENSDHFYYGIGAVVFKSGGRIISSGRNCFRSSSIPDKYKRYPHTLHAEQSAINGLNWEVLKGASILVVRINMQSSEMSMGFPCKYCYQTIKFVGIKSIYYSNRKGEIVRRKV